MSIEERFWSKVNRKTEDECWEWTGAKANRYGYILFEGKIKKAAHVVLALQGIRVPRGKVVLHECDNPPCVNPKHLKIGTQKENMEDASKKGRCGAQKYPEKYKNGRPPVMKGEQNPASKLQKDDVLEIRRCYEAGEMTQVQLAAKFYVTQAMISLIVKRLKWKDI